MAGFSCPNCGKTLPVANDVYQHMKAKHGKPAAREFKAKHIADDQREMSTGAELVAAAEAARCGEPVPEHIAMMFPEEIRAARRAGRV